LQKSTPSSQFVTPS
jgi:hypothetical protein